MNEVARQAAIEALIVKDGLECFYCERQLSRSGKKKNWTLITIDHVLPRALGGTDDLSNLVLACHPCNNRKGRSIVGLIGVLRAQRATIKRLRTAIDSQRLKNDRAFGDRNLELRRLRAANEKLWNRVNELSGI